MRIRADPDPDQKHCMKWNYASIYAKVMDRGGAGVKYLYIRFVTTVFNLKRKL